MHLSWRGQQDKNMTKKRIREDGEPDCLALCTSVYRKLELPLVNGRWCYVSIHSLKSDTHHYLSNRSKPPLVNTVHRCAATKQTNAHQILPKLGGTKLPNADSSNRSTYSRGLSPEIFYNISAQSPGPLHQPIPCACQFLSLSYHTH